MKRLGKIVLSGSILFTLSIAFGMEEKGVHCCDDCLFCNGNPLRSDDGGRLPADKTCDCDRQGGNTIIYSCRFL